MDALKEGVYYDMPDSEYHAQHGRDEHFYSSSQLKTIVEDELKFKKEYIDGQKEEVGQALEDAFAIGTVVHTAILEPDKLKGSFALWKKEFGNRKGKKWDDFKKKNEGRPIITERGKKSATMCRDSFKKHPIAPLYIDHNTGSAEVSFFVVFMGMKIKVRTDWLGNGYIADIKTASGDVRNAGKIKNKIKELGYDLSAALYVDVVNYAIDYFDLDIPYVETFLWIFVSKDKENNCKVYDGRAYLELGRAKYKKAIEMIKKHEAEGWQMEEEVCYLAPNSFEVGDWITKEEVNIDDL